MGVHHVTVQHQHVIKQHEHVHVKHELLEQHGNGTTTGSAKHQMHVDCACFVLCMGICACACLDVDAASVCFVLTRLLDLFVMCLATLVLHLHISVLLLPAVRLNVLHGPVHLVWHTPLVWLAFNYVSQHHHHLVIVS
jgi:hypothetical protein